MKIYYYVNMKICIGWFIDIFVILFGDVYDSKSRLLEKDIYVSKNGHRELTGHLPNYDNMEGHQFEHFCANVIKENGFINVQVTPGSGDHGIDILAEKVYTVGILQLY